jgi:hypothetical protein
MNILNPEDIGISFKLIPYLTANQYILFPAITDRRELLLADEPARNLNEKNGKKIYLLNGAVVYLPRPGVRYDIRFLDCSVLDGIPVHRENVESV